MTIRHRRRLSKGTRGELIWLGAAIVFATFTVKEGIRDFIADKIREIELTESAYYTNGGTLASMNMLADVSSRIDALKDLGAGADSHGFTKVREPELKVLSRESRFDMVAMGMTLSFLERLVDRLERDATATAAEFRTLQTRAHALRSTEEALLKAVDQRHLDEREAQNTVRDLTNQIADVTRLTFDLTTYSDHLFEAFERTKHHAERTLTLSTWISYALFVVGWALALFSRLNGSEQKELAG